jgi:hypothetical protein
LTQAVTSGDESVVASLLGNGVDVNERTSGGQTALILAIVFGHTNLVRLLVRAGADPQLRDNLGLNAIEWAQRRGLTEALAILTKSRRSNTLEKVIGQEEGLAPAVSAAERGQAPLPEPSPPELVPSAATPAEEKNNKPISVDDKSQRWIAGLKQRLNEQELRRLNRNEPEPAPSTDAPPPALMSVATSEAALTETINIQKPVEPEPALPALEPIPIEQPAIATSTNVSTSKGTRKRCPRCNAIYDSDLVSYCAHHIVPLVDADEPIVSETPRSTPPLFWIMVVITLSGSIVAASLITAYIYESNSAAARSAAAQQQPIIQKGVPEVGGDLAGKAVTLPEAECPVSGPEPLEGTVTVRVVVDRSGQVNWARGSGGDWLMRGASTEAAMKSTFAPEKLRSRETEGTITYTFKP